jgi:hypothetical protein
MKRALAVLVPLFVVVCVLGFARPAAAHFGSVVWGSWSFDWEVRDNAGLALRNVKYKQKTLIYKASMPVIRVRYQDDKCGPFADQINWDNLLNISNCGDAKVCQRSFTQGGKNWMQIDVLAGIGKYLITQSWFLTDDGWLHPQLSSKGLHCDLDHDHHPYWRMDFDIDGAAQDQLFTHNKPGGGCAGADEGWGPGWHKETNEGGTIKLPELERYWWVQDQDTKNAMGIKPSGDDGTFDSFSNIDGARRRYHDGEDVGWAFGAWGELGYDDGEDVQEKDDVFWYVAHLHHIAADGADQWHRAGPWLWIKQ